MVNFFPTNGNIPSLIAREDGRRDLRHVPDSCDLMGINLKLGTMAGSLMTTSEVGEEKEYKEAASLEGFESCSTAFRFIA